MELDPKLYSMINITHFERAHQLLDKVKQENAQQSKNFNIIVDIGCGCGNITQVLSQTFPDSLIIGLDVDIKMIKYARKNHMNDRIKYIVQDIGEDWQQLDEELKQMEGKVSLIFSNYALQMVYEKGKAFNNIETLLAKDGMFCANIVLFEDFIPKHVLKRRKQKIIAKYGFYIPTIDEQMREYKDYLINCDVKYNNSEQIDLKIFHSKSTLSSLLWQFYYGIKGHSFFSFYKTFIKGEPESRRCEIINKLRNIMQKEMLKRNDATRFGVVSRMLKLALGFDVTFNLKMFENRILAVKR